MHLYLLSLNIFILRFSLPINSNILAGGVLFDLPTGIFYVAY